MKKIIVAISGASGAIYAQRLVYKLGLISEVEVGVVMSKNALVNWELEIGSFDAENFPFQIYNDQDYNAPFASGSAKYNTMIIVPSSMGLIGRIASGMSNSLTTRAADVILKERRKLIIVPRETPYSLIHLKNMTTITQAGGIICPATPSFYSQPQDKNEIVDTVVDRVLDLAGIDHSTYRWGS